MIRKLLIRINSAQSIIYKMFGVSSLLSVFYLAELKIIKSTEAKKDI